MKPKRGYRISALERRGTTLYQMQYANWSLYFDPDELPTVRGRGKEKPRDLTPFWFVWKREIGGKGLEYLGYWRTKKAFFDTL